MCFVCINGVLGLTDLWEIVMCERKGDIGNLGLHLRATGFVLWAAGPRDATGKASFVKFVAKESRSPKTLDALRCLRLTVEKYGKKDPRGFLRYSVDLGNGFLELHSTEGGDEYVRAVNLRSEAVHLETEWSSHAGVQECFDRLYEAMILDQNEFPQ